MATNFAPFDLKTLPKRNTGPKVDTAAANALLAVITEHGAATDGTKYETAEQARTGGMRAVRLLNHVMPEGKRGTIRTFALDGGGFGYTVYLTDAKSDDAAESKGKSKGK